MKTLILLLVSICLLAGCATAPKEPAPPAAPPEPWVPVGSATTE